MEARIWGLLLFRSRRLGAESSLIGNLEIRQCIRVKISKFLLTHLDGVGVHVGHANAGVLIRLQGHVRPLGFVEDEATLEAVVRRRGHLVLGSVPPRPRGHVQSGKQQEIFVCGHRMAFVGSKRTFSSSSACCRRRGR